MTNLTEPKLQELLRACLAGDRKAQQSLYQQFAPVIYAICVRYMGVTDEAKDMLQETMVKFFQKSNEFRFQGSLEGWVKRIAVNTCLDQIKRNKAKYASSLDEAYELAGDVNATQPLETKDLLRLVSSLPDGYRAVFNMYAIEGFSHAEIGEVLGISENTSKSQLFKARKWLQAKVERS
ncbi:MAG: RNA polymerase sigma factor [Bacteroidota bacterium]